MWKYMSQTDRGCTMSSATSEIRHCSFLAAMLFVCTNKIYKLFS